MPTLRDSNVLILGGSGFIGSSLAIRLVDDGANVTIVDSMLPQYGGNLANLESIVDKVSINFSDIRDQHSLRYLVKGQDFIFSLAGQTSHIESMQDPLTDLEINTKAQISVVEMCRQFNPKAVLVFASTRQFYGRPQYLPVDEKHPLEPVDVNGINKLAGELYYALYSRVYDMCCVSLRLTNTYGPRQQVRGTSQGFAGSFVRKAISGEPIEIFGDGQQRRDFNYIDDVVDALLLAAQTPELAGSAVNLGAPNNYSLLDFVTILQKFCDFEYRLKPFPPEYDSIDIGDYYADYSLFKEKTGWEAKVDLEEGLRRTVEYFAPRREKYW